jgi:hypothetical protein
MNQDTQVGSQASEAAPDGGGSPVSQKSSLQPEMKSLFIQGLYAILFLFILIAALQLYFSIQEFIRTWFSEEFIPIVNSLYYLAVVAGGIYLILQYIRSR